MEEMQSKQILHSQIKTMFNPKINSQKNKLKKIAQLKLERETTNSISCNSQFKPTDLPINSPFPRNVRDQLRRESMPES